MMGGQSVVRTVDKVTACQQRNEIECLDPAKAYEFQI